VSGLEAELHAIERDTLARIRACDDVRGLEDVRVRVLGKKGELTRILRGLAELSPEERPAAGKLVNRSKETIEAALDTQRAELEGRDRDRRLAGAAIDVTLPAFGQPPGHIHPLSRTTDEICDVLRGLGFSIADGPDVEDEYHNFEALNIPADHPARDMQDTFFLTDGRVLRTHTSPVQIRIMERTQPPLRIIAPGAVYRPDDDVTHSPMFHQVECFMIDRGVTFGHLKHVLEVFLRSIFGPQCRLRFRPSFFPFTEPSAEVDIGCVICGGSGSLGASACRVCKGGGWLEILGAGMVDPAVFEAVGYDPEVWTGFAFGMGVERIAMLKYGIDDMRLLFGGDLRFLEQF
jgi:phenylalanyl-tRNA synthetase alpha chain